ncbi:MAG: MoxR family ATPase [Bacteroidota bacterium]|nr:MoxR family ATPase [Bacteroidota bacterium]
MDDNTMFQSRIDLSELVEVATHFQEEIGKVIVGQKDMIELMLVAMLADGHVLIEGVPGVAKTLMVKLMAKASSVKYSRVQFTPDLMPSDVTGTNVFNLSKSEFQFNAGPIFANMVLIDEINRAPAKTQSSLFEVMEERQVTIDGKSHAMAPPFVVFATQNPIEHEGTYRLPEAQLDRFLFKIEAGYPTPEEEELILMRSHARQSQNEVDAVNTVITGEQVIRFQKLVKEVQIEESLRKYIVQITAKTRNHSSIYLGASPRASINLMNAAKAYAAINGRDFVTPEDIRVVVKPVLQHRIQLTPEKELEGKTPSDILDGIIQSIDVPR